MFRTYSKEILVHIIAIGCMVLALGVTGYYFGGAGSTHVPELLSGILLFPLSVLQMYTGCTFETLITHNPTVFFLMLWISYSAVAVWMAPLLLVKAHSEEELHKWYKGRTQTS